MMQAEYTPEEKAMRRRELYLCTEPFRQILTHIYSIMPCPGFVVDLETGSFTPNPILPEWQKQIDRVIEMRNEYVKTNFPEFYEY